MQDTHKAMVLGATGAVGHNVLHALLESPSFSVVTTLGRRPLAPEDPLSTSTRLTQHVVDVFSPAAYEGFIAGHDVAFCTLGVGQPSKVSPEEFLRVDITCVADFAAACKRQGVQHFSLMTVIGANPRSRMRYVRLKGDLEERVKALGFARLSLFQPSMLLTKENRYGLSQGILLALWPCLHFAMVGPLRRARGIRVEDLGRAMVRNAERPATQPCEVFDWDGFQGLLK